MASIEAYPSNIPCQVVTPELLKAINECPPSQLREIYYHHSNTLDIYNQAYSENVFGNQVRLSNLSHDIERASTTHDLGKILVPGDVFPISLPKKKVIEHFHKHPADTVKLLGEKFCQLYQKATQITIHHHWYGPNYLSETDQQQLGFTITPLNQLDDNTLLALTVFVASDRATALVEDRQYNKKEDGKSDDEIIAELQKDIKFLNLNQSNPFIHPINFPALVEIAQTVSQQNQHILKPTESLHQSF